jgi:hypothetical protein
MLMGLASGKSRLRVFETNVELELEPLELREHIELILTLASLCVVSCGGILLFGGVWLHVHGKTAWTGLWLVLGGGASFFLLCWLQEPHKAAKHTGCGITPANYAVLAVCNLSQL